MEGAQLASTFGVSEEKTSLPLEGGGPLAVEGVAHSFNGTPLLLCRVAQAPVHDTVVVR